MLRRLSINRQMIYAFIAQHKLPLLTVAVVAGMLVVYHATQRGPAFPDWDKARGTNSDPRDPAASPDPAKDKLVKLSGQELHQLILNMECLTDMASAHDQLIGDYNALYRRIANPNVQEALFLRIKNQQPFKHAELSVQWQQFYEHGEIGFIDIYGTSYVSSRVARIRLNIIGGRYHQFDINFVSDATAHLNNDFPNVADWVNKAKLLQGWLVDDSILTSDSTLTTSIDEFANVSELIASIQKRHTNGPSTGPQAIARVRELDASLIAKLTDKEHSNLMTRLKYEIQWLTINRNPDEYVHEGIQLPNPQRQVDLWAYMSDPKLDWPHVLDRPLAVLPLEQLKMNYVLRKGMFGTILEPLRSAIKEGDVENASTISSSYAQILANNVTLDPKQEQLFSDQIAALQSPDVEQIRLTVTQVQIITTAGSWLDSALRRYTDEEAKMNNLLAMLRSSKNQRLRILVLPYSSIDGIIDPFQQSPMDLMAPSDNDARAAISGVPFPRFALPEDSHKQP